MRPYVDKEQDIETMEHRTYIKCTTIPLHSRELKNCTNGSHNGPDGSRKMKT